MIHQNPISALPLSFAKVVPQLQTFGLDWFAYLQPSVGKILRLKDKEDDRQLNDDESDAIEAALQDAIALRNRRQSLNS